MRLAIRTGGTFPVRSLEADGSGELVIPPLLQRPWGKESIEGTILFLLRVSLRFLGLDVAGEEDLYVEPTFNTFPGVDSLARVGGTWIGFQMTVSSSHSINATKVAEHLKHLGVQGPFKIYFVVPQDSYEHYQIQSYKFKGDKNPLDRYDAEQWVLGIDLTPQ